jgi:hypothetical protein
MNGLDYRSFFVHPVEAAHRRYEALRSVFVEERPMKEVAQRYDVSYGTIRNWVSEFCRAQDDGQSPPFSPRRHVGVPRPTSFLPMTRMRKSKSPMFRRCRWRPDGDWSRDTRASSYSCPCSHKSASTVSSRGPITRVRKWCRPPTLC